MNNKEFEENYRGPLSYMVEKEYEKIMKEASRLLKTIDVSEKDRFKIEGIIAAFDCITEK